MAKVTIKLNTSGVRQFLRSDMLPICEEHGKRIKNMCGDGYEMNTAVGRNRCNAMVWADTWGAKRDNLERNTLIKALGGSK